MLPDSTKNEMATYLSFELEGTFIVRIVWLASECAPLFQDFFFRSVVFFCCSACYYVISLSELSHSFFFSTGILGLQIVEMLSHLLLRGCSSLEPGVLFNLIESETFLRILFKHSSNEIKQVLLMHKFLLFHASDGVFH